MKPPFFPVDFSQVGSHFVCRGIENPAAKVIVCHHNSGVQMLTVEDFERGNGFVSFGQKGRYPICECLVIWMYLTNHPERTISYRIEERPSGKVFVFLTDHENLDTLPVTLRRHLQHADLLVMDSQYSRERYGDPVNGTAGYGHGTPDFCVRTALLVGAKRLGLTHHDPSSTDDDVEAILAEGRSAYALLQKEIADSPLKVNQIFLCRDSWSVELHNLLPL